MGRREEIIAALKKRKITREKNGTYRHVVLVLLGVGLSVAVRRAVEREKKKERGEREFVDLGEIKGEGIEH